MRIKIKTGRRSISISSINRGNEEISTQFIGETPPFLAGKDVMVRSEFLL
jgi:hypothetical protein